MNIEDQRTVAVHKWIGAHQSQPRQSLAVEPEPWMAAALCTQVDPEMFYPEQGGSTRAPKRICAGCDVRTECLTYAIERNERDGIWGGLSPRERAAVGRGAA